MKIETLEPETNKSEANPRVVSKAEWLVARKDLLTREKELTRLRDEVSRHRRELPWVRVDKEYIFDGPDGKETLADLFEDRSQLIVYHFMFAPGWEEGCKSCSYLADHFDGANWHLPHRDVTFVVISRAPLTELDAYKKRMRWRFKWVSAYGNDFNFDYHRSEEHTSELQSQSNIVCRPLPEKKKNQQGSVQYTNTTYSNIPENTCKFNFSTKISLKKSYSNIDRVLSRSR